MLAFKALALVFVACVASGQTAHAFRYTHCRLNEAGSIPRSAEVDICRGAGDDHCIVKRGQTLTYHMEFDTVRPFQGATFRVSQVNLTNQYEVFDSIDACKSATGLKCPSDEGTKQSVDMTLTFNEKFPAGFHVCRFELIDENMEPITCKQFLASVE